MGDIQVIIGVDNGISGGLCAISSHDGSVIDSIAMPTEEANGKSEVYVKGVLYWLDQFSPLSTLVAIEEPLRHAKSSQAMRSMSISFGKILGLCETIEYPVYRVQVKEWQDVKLGKRLAKGQTKVKALAVANDLWPEENWLATSRSRIPHDGMVDAALIAHYYLNYKV
jgi:hypothetical protein